MVRISLSHRHNNNIIAPSINIINNSSDNISITAHAKAISKYSLSTIYFTTNLEVTLSFKMYHLVNETKAPSSKMGDSCTTSYFRPRRPFGDHLYFESPLCKVVHDWIISCSERTHLSAKYRGLCFKSRQVVLYAILNKGAFQSTIFDYRRLCSKMPTMVLRGYLGKMRLFCAISKSRRLWSKKPTILWWATLNFWRKVPLWDHLRFKTPLFKIAYNVTSHLLMGKSNIYAEGYFSPKEEYLGM